MAACAGRDDVVFGTVMSGRLQGPRGIERMLGSFINTPPRARRPGRDERARPGEHHRPHPARPRAPRAEPPLAVAHGHSAVPPETPLFNAILNYRHLESDDRIDDTALERAGVKSLAGVIERSNYPIALSVDDLGHSYSLDAQIDQAQDAELVIRYLETAMERLVDALTTEGAEQRPRPGTCRS